MSMTQTEASDAVKDYLDTTGAARWSASTILSALSKAHWDEWGAILGANPNVRQATRTVTTDASGRIALTDLDSGSGDTKEWHYRVLAVTDGGDTRWEVVEFQDVPMGTTSNYPASFNPIVYHAGDYLQLLPVAGSASRSVTVNHLPQKVSGLAGGSSTIVFPDGHDLTYIYGACALLAVKGGAELEAAQAYRAMADECRWALLSDIARKFGQPTLMLGTPDSMEF